MPPLRDKSPNSLFYGDTFHHSNEEIQNLKKSLRAKEADYQKLKAVSEQKVQLLEMQIDESREREDNLKKLQEKML